MRIVRRSVRLIACVGIVSMVALGVAALDALAQDLPPLEIVGGVTFLSNSDVVDLATAGWLAGGGWNLTDHVGLELQVSGFTRSQTVTFLEVDARFLTFVAGPKMAWQAGPLDLFGRSLVGTTAIDLNVTSDFLLPSTGTSHETNGTVQLGVGIALPLGRGASARLAYDYRRIFAVERFNQHGVSLSVAYGFGGS